MGKNLTGWRKIVVGDRAWRIIFSTNAEETGATVWVIGDRDDSACYETARHRVEALPKGQAQATSLAATMYQLGRRQRASRRQPRGKKR